MAFFCPSTQIRASKSFFSCYLANPQPRSMAKNDGIEFTFQLISVKKVA